MDVVLAIGDVLDSHLQNHTRFRHTNDPPPLLLSHGCGATRELAVGSAKTQSSHPLFIDIISISISITLYYYYIGTLLQPTAHLH